MPAISVNLSQQSATVTEADVRSHKVLIDRPESKGGTDAGMMGGEMLLVALGGCFNSNLLEAIRTRDAAISDVKVAVVGTLEGKPAKFTAAEIQVSATADDSALLEKLVTISERSCIVANSLKSGMDVTVKVV